MEILRLAFFEPGSFEGFPGCVDTSSLSPLGFQQYLLYDSMTALRPTTPQN